MPEPLSKQPGEEVAGAGRAVSEAVSAWFLPRQRQLEVFLLAFIIAIHLGNAIVPAIWYDEATNVNVAAALAETGQYGNTWQSAQPIVPDRFVSTGPPVILLSALGWKLGIHGPVGLRLFVVTPFFVLLVLLGHRLTSELAPATRALTLVLLLGIPGWGLFSSRVLGEFPALCLTCAGALLILRERVFPAALLWGLAGITKLVFLPGLAVGWAIRQLANRRGGKHLVPFAIGMLLPICSFTAYLWSRYGQSTDLALSLQGSIVIFHPRNFPLNLATLNQYVPIVLVAIGLAYGWTARKSEPELHLLCCLSMFWIAWHLVGFRGWLRYIVPALWLLAPCMAAGLVHACRATSGYVRGALVLATAAFVGLGLYDNTYSIWTNYKDWREQQRILGFLSTKRGHRVLGDGYLFPFPDYQWLTGLKFESAKAIPSQPGDIVLFRREQAFTRNAFLVREMDAGRAGDWRFVFDTSTVEIYERR